MWFSPKTQRFWQHKKGGSLSATTLEHIKIFQMMMNIEKILLQKFSLNNAFLLPILLFLFTLFLVANVEGETVAGDSNSADQLLESLLLANGVPLTGEELRDTKICDENMPKLFCKDEDHEKPVEKEKSGSAINSRNDRKKVINRQLWGSAFIEIRIFNTGSTQHSENIRKFFLKIPFSRGCILISKYFWYRVQKKISYP